MALHDCCIQVVHELLPKFVFSPKIQYALDILNKVSDHHLHHE
jgi:hypothetical protein